MRTRTHTHTRYMDGRSLDLYSFAREQQKRDHLICAQKYFTHLGFQMNEHQRCLCGQVRVEPEGTARVTYSTYRHRSNMQIARPGQAAN